MNTTTVSALATRELSLKARFGHVVLLLVSLTMAVITGSLLLTEQALPARTTLSFAVMTIMGLCWAAYALWVLASRRVLLAFHKVVATWLAVIFCSVALAGALAVALSVGKSAAWLAVTLFGLMLLIAIMLQQQARRKLRQLNARREELEQQLKDHVSP